MTDNSETTTTKRPSDEPAPDKDSWEEQNEACRHLLGHDAVQIAMGVFCERLADPTESPLADPSHAHLLVVDERTHRLAAILGSEGDLLSRLAAAQILRALDDPRVDVVKLAHRSGGIQIPPGFYTDRGPFKEPVPPPTLAEVAWHAIQFTEAGSTLHPSPSWGDATKQQCTSCLSTGDDNCPVMAVVKTTPCPFPDDPPPRAP